MKTLKFSLSGDLAHFKRPDVNEEVYFTYNHIPKVALLGLMGAILGLSGYNDQGNDDYPEFFRKLRNLKVAIVPISSSKGIFRKKIQVFNNSTGFGNIGKPKVNGKQMYKGDNLIVREQWLENVAWDIYIDMNSLVEQEVLDKLQDYLLNGKAVYPPYLGKNDHFAQITDACLIELEEAMNPEYISSLFPCHEVKLDDETYDEDYAYTFKDHMPMAINQEGMYIFEKLGFTNRMINTVKSSLYRDQDHDRILYFI